ncbi:hypothetical protein JW777_05500 [bacterium]|nr:hypothetical protein [bacterium]
MPIPIRQPMPCCAFVRIILCGALFLLSCFSNASGQNPPSRSVWNGTHALIRTAPDMNRPLAWIPSHSLFFQGQSAPEPMSGAPDRPAWRWARDAFFRPPGGLRRDKLEHFAASACLYSILRVYEAEERSSASAVFSTGVLWEVKDAIVPWERFGFWGGDGFSWRDLCADGLGIAAAVLVWRGP